MCDPEPQSLTPAWARDKLSVLTMAFSNGAANLQGGCHPSAHPGWRVVQVTQAGSGGARVRTCVWPLPPSEDSRWCLQGLRARLPGETEKVATHPASIPCHAPRVAALCRSLLPTSLRPAGPSPHLSPVLQVGKLGLLKVTCDSLGVTRLVSRRARTRSADGNVLRLPRPVGPGGAGNCDRSRGTPCLVWVRRVLRSPAWPLACPHAASTGSVSLPFPPRSVTLGTSLCLSASTFSQPRVGPVGPTFTPTSVLGSCFYPKSLSAPSTPARSPPPTPHPEGLDSSHQPLRPGPQRRAPAAGRAICPRTPRD